MSQNSVPSVADVGRFPDAQVRFPSAELGLHHAGLLIVSCLALALFANSAAIVPFVALTAIASYVALVVGQHAIARFGHVPHIAGWLNTFNWLGWIGAFIGLEATGAVGTLTGNSDSLADQWLVTLGLPFYALAMASANSDMLLGKQARPPLGLYLLYVMYFPKFLSGPIEKPNFIETLRAFRFRLDWRLLDQGGRWIILGVFYKMLIGRYLAKFYFPAVTDDLATLALGIVAFELRVYFDLCGYSLMAYGASMMLGIPLTLNFNHPFFAKDIRNFWRCWHISLGRWFNEYVYEPLRKHTRHPQLLVFAPMAVFLCSAGWHGITANFLLWGLFHAFAFIFYTKVLRHRSWPKPVQWLGLLGTLAFGRLLFMEADLSRLMLKIARLVNFSSWATTMSYPRDAFRTLIDLNGLNALMMTVALVAFALWTELRNVRAGVPAYSLFLGWRLYVIVGLLVVLATNGSEGMIYARQ